MKPGEHVRTNHLELLSSEMCPKCGTFPQPVWRHPAEVARLADKPDHEFLEFKCPCGFSWKTPTRDAGSRTERGVVLPKGYMLHRDDRAPASPAGYRVVLEGGR